MQSMQSVQEQKEYLPDVGYIIESQLLLSEKEVVDGAKFIGDLNPVHNDPDNEQTIRLGGIIASGSVQQQSHMELNTSLTLLALSICKLSLLASHGNRLQLVRMPWCVGVLDAILALIKVGTSRAVEAIALENLSGACCTLLDKLGRISVVQMPEDHH